MTGAHASRATPEVSRWADWPIEVGALFLLVFTPLAYGTVEPWSEAIAVLVVLAMVAAWALQATLAGSEFRVKLPPAWLPAALFLALIAVQAVPLPRILLEVVSPWTLSLREIAAAHVGSQVNFAPLSLDPHATWREALKLLAVAAFFLVCYNTYRTRAQIARALWTMIAMGTVISIFGILQRMTWNGRFYWVGPEAPHASAFGPFVNRTHFAGLMVIVVPFALALVLPRWQDGTRRGESLGWARRFRAWNSTQAGPTPLVWFLILLMGGAALISGSRGGVLALIAALFSMMAIGARGRTGRGRAGRVVLAAVLIVLAALWISAEVFSSTLERLALELGRPEEGARLRIWADAVGLWQKSPAVGIGLASFGGVFPMVRTLEAPARFAHAESDWVEFLIGTGLLGLGLAAGVATILGLTLLRQYRDAFTPWTRALALAGIVALVGSVVQGIGNYNLAVMSNFIYLALALVLTFTSENRRGVRSG